MHVFFYLKSCILICVADTTPPRKVIDKQNSTLFEVNAPDGFAFLFLFTATCSQSIVVDVLKKFGVS